MKKIVLGIFLLLISTFSFAAENPLQQFETKEMRERINNHRNYAHPRIIRDVTIKYREEYNEDMSDPIFFGIYIIKNLSEKYSSQTLLSEIVQSLSYFPKENNLGIYSIIYVANYTSLTDVITFERKDNNIEIEIYNEESVNKLVLKIKKIENVQYSFEIFQTTIDIQPSVSRDFIKGCWYSLWNKVFSPHQRNFIYENQEQEKYYNEITELFNKYTWIEFCRASPSKAVDDLIKYYKNSNKILEYQDTLSFVELINRCFIAPM